MNDIIFRREMTVKLVDEMANDAMVIQAAKVSTIGENDPTLTDTEASSGFINFLMKNRHGSPFEQAVFKFYIECPIFVMREFIRHRMASYNEMSGRYKELQPVFYTPSIVRPLQQVGKPGHYHFEPGTGPQTVAVNEEIEDCSKQAYASYQRMLYLGVAKEVARMVLPVNIYTSFYVTMNARGLMNFLSLRTKDNGSHFPSYPQYEIELVAKEMEKIFAEEMPLTHTTFCINGRVSP
ncbi:ThyX-like thymidylate synthase [Gordonia phage RobinSparkles]|nr:ThyX-like thymidylate synthase [Gordonia phage RobinSparkles]